MKATETLCLLLIVSLFLNACNDSGTTIPVNEGTPTARATVEYAESYVVHEGIKFDAGTSVDNDTEGVGIIEYAWDFQGDGTWDLATPDPVTVYAYSIYGQYGVQCRVMDNEFEMDTLDVPIELEINGIVIHFGDAEVEQDIRLRLNKPEGPIHIYDVADIDKIHYSDVVLDSLEGLQYLPNLRILEAENCSFLDSSAILDMDQLQKLELTGLNCSDFSLGPQNSNLESLTLTNCVTDYFYFDETYSYLEHLPGLEHATNLTMLDLSRNSISDLYQVSAMTEMEELYLDNNKITTLAPLALMKDLEVLVASHNYISDISALSRLTSLRSVDISDNNVTDLMPLLENESFRDGAWLDISNNPINSDTVEQIIMLQDRGVYMNW